MNLTILGCHSAVPRIHSHPTSQVLEIKNHLFLIDCGEGTQVQLRKYKIKFARIKHIFISHLHGDHFFGLVGLISSFRLLGRDTSLHIYAPKGLENVIRAQLALAQSHINFKIIFIELNKSTSQFIFEDDKVEVHTIPLVHRVYTNGFLFKEKKGDYRLNIEAAQEAQVDVAYYNKLKKGMDVPNKKGEIVSYKDLTFSPLKSKSYAFCSDTAYSESIVPLITQVDALYHESTFLDKHKDLASPTKHSTAKQAAHIAKLAQVKQLFLGHYSTRYKEISPFKEEAQTIFENVVLCEAGMKINI